MPRKTPEFAVGDKVQLTGKFLRSTGQITGSEGQRKWIVQACDCAHCRSGQFIRTDERRSAELLEYYTAEELAENEALYWRHINTANLKLVGKPSSRDVY